MSVYRVVIDVKSKMLATVLSLIDDNADITLVSVTNAQDPALPPAPLPPATSNGSNGFHRYAGGVRKKAVSGDSVVEGVLKSGPATLAELKQAFEHNGYSPNSTATYVNKLLKADRIVRGTGGRFSWSGK